MEYTFTDEAKELSPEDIWIKIQGEIVAGSKMKSIKGLEYTIHSVTNDRITYKAESRSNHENETIDKQDFLTVITRLKKEVAFNTSSSREHFPSAIYRQRSPLFAILLAGKIISHA